MKRIRLLIMAALAVLAVGAITAVAAQAASEGPFWAYCKNVGLNKGKFNENKCKEEGGKKEWERSRLVAGETLDLRAEGTENFVLANGVQTITCLKQHLENGEVIGSTGGNAGTSKEIAVFEECTVLGNGAECEPFSEKTAGKKELGVIRTEAIKKVLEFSKEVTAKGDIHLVLFVPVKGVVFVKLKFTGKVCTFTEVALEGSVDAELDNAKKEPLKLEENEELGESVLVHFPKAFIKTAWEEVGGKRKEKKASLKLLGKAANQFTGHSRLTLLLGGAPIVDWGVFTH